MAPVQTPSNNTRSLNNGRHKEAFVCHSEILSTEVVFTGDIEGEKAFHIPKDLLDRYIIPAAVSLQPLEAQPNNAKQLDILLVNLVKAPDQGFVWTSEKNGTAKNGAFIRTNSPAFRFTYPKTSLKQTKMHFPGQIMAMKTLVKGYIAASIREIPADTKLAEVGPRFFTRILERLGSNIKVISNRKIMLSDGSEAYMTDINWNFKSIFRFRTLLISAFKDGKWVSLGYSILIDYYVASISENLNEGNVNH